MGGIATCDRVPLGLLQAATARGKAEVGRGYGNLVVTEVCNWL